MAFIDYTEAFFWTLTYIIIALTGIINKNEKRLCMPVPSLWINFSWETASIIRSFQKGFNLFSQGHFIRFSWFVFDIFILWCFFEKNDFFRKKKLPLFGYITAFLILTTFFLCSFNFEYGMPITAFIIDALMEVLFWFQRKKFDPANRLAIGVTKILGDLFAGIYYGSVHPTVIVLACIAFFFDVLYIIYAVKEKQLNPDINNNFIRNKTVFLKKVKLLFVEEKQYQKRRSYKKKQKNKKTHRKK